HRGRAVPLGLQTTVRRTSKTDSPEGDLMHKCNGRLFDGSACNNLLLECSGCGTTGCQGEGCDSQQFAGSSCDCGATLAAPAPALAGASAA
ncbi:MAG TPA: hypothetical protein VHE57_00445, partial [Mycobacteriales bacterium]|nr:hypothetical protein [Mycobacteriales bacterium]